MLDLQPAAAVPRSHCVWLDATKRAWHRCPSALSKTVTHRQPLTTYKLSSVEMLRPPQK